MKIKSLKNIQFKEVYKKGKFYKDENMKLYFLEDSNNENFFGIALNKEFGTAVLRNKIKRRIREIYKIVNLKKGYQILLIPSKKVRELNFSELKIKVEDVFKKADLIKND